MPTMPRVNLAHPPARAYMLRFFATGAIDGGEVADRERHPLFRTVAELAALRREEPALRDGEWRADEARASLVTFERRRGRRRVLVAINRGRTAAAST